MQHYLQYQRLDPDYHLPRALVIKISRHTIKNHHPASTFQVADVLLFVVDNKTRSTSSMVEAAYLTGRDCSVFLVVKSYEGPGAEVQVLLPINPWLLERVLLSSMLPIA